MKTFEVATITKCTNLFESIDIKITAHNVITVTLSDKPNFIVNVLLFSGNRAVL